MDYAWGVTTMLWNVQNIKGKELTDSVQVNGGSQDHRLMNVWVHKVYTSYEFFFIQIHM